MIWSPSTSAPSAVTARHRSASPSWAMPRSAPCSSTAARSASRWVRTAAVVDVEPVRLGVDRDHLGAGLAGTPPGATSEAAPFAQSTTTCEPVQPVRHGRRPDAARSARRRRAGRAPGRCRRRSGGARRPPVRRDGRLDPHLDLVGQLVPAGGEELDPVVRHRVVRGGEHHAEVGLGLAGQVRHRRGGQHADPQHVRRRRWSARPPPPPPASRRWPGGPGRPPRAAGGRDPVSARVCAAATATASASSGVRSVFARPRTPSVPNSRPMRGQPPESAPMDAAESRERPAPPRRGADRPFGQTYKRGRRVMISASSTAAPCGPS